MVVPKIICLTPVKNEAWILERFLKCASLWADHIIIADQGSDDGSREIARGFPKVTLIDNPARAFNEPERQKLLISEARNIPGPRLLIALDADEFLTANVLTSTEWKTVLHAPPGTVVRFQLPIILKDVSSYWIHPSEFAFGFMDDGSEHSGSEIHTTRIPIPAGSPEICLREIKAMHYVGVDPLRSKSRQRWYQCWELLNQPHKRPVDIYRFYHRSYLYDIPHNKISCMPREWLLAYQEQGIDMTSIPRKKFYRWDKDILQLFASYGTNKFRKLAIWDIDWSKMYKEINGIAASTDLRDPRTLLDRVVHRWLRSVQPYLSHYGPPCTRSLRLYLRTVDKFLKLLGW